VLLLMLPLAPAKTFPFTAPLSPPVRRKMSSCALSLGAHALENCSLTIGKMFCYKQVKVFRLNNRPKLFSFYMRTPLSAITVHDGVAG
jgi:hypothetical protein